MKILYVKQGYSFDLYQGIARPAPPEHIKKGLRVQGGSRYSSYINYNQGFRHLKLLSCRPWAITQMVYNYTPVHLVESVEFCGLCTRWCLNESVRCTLCIAHLLFRVRFVITPALSIVLCAIARYSLFHSDAQVIISYWLAEVNRSIAQIGDVCVLLTNLRIQPFFCAKSLFNFVWSYNVRLCKLHLVQIARSSCLSTLITGPKLKSL